MTKHRWRFFLKRVTGLVLSGIGGKKRGIPESKFTSDPKINTWRSFSSHPTQTMIDVCFIINTDSKGGQVTSWSRKRVGSVMSELLTLEYILYMKKERTLFFWGCCTFKRLWDTIHKDLQWDVEIKDERGDVRPMTTAWTVVEQCRRTTHPMVAWDTRIVNRYFLGSSRKC